MNKECTKEKKEKIRITLAQLLERTNDDAFVIIEDEATGKFVQFAGNKWQGLFFDLPTQPLNPEELERAMRLLGEYGIHLEKWPVCENTENKSSGTQSGFQNNLGIDINKGVELAWRVIKEVYQIESDFNMIIEDN